MLHGQVPSLAPVRVIHSSWTAPKSRRGTGRVLDGPQHVQVADNLPHVQCQADLHDSTEVVPGVYCGGEAAAAGRVLEGAASPLEYRFFSGSLSWQPKQLQQEIAGGIWRTAECSRSVVLKQCMQLPVPMWREVHRLLDVAVE